MPREAMTLGQARREIAALDSPQAVDAWMAEHAEQLLRLARRDYDAYAAFVQFVSAHWNRVAGMGDRTTILGGG